MTTITLQVPDQLAQRIAPLKAQLPQLLTHTLDLYAPEESTTAKENSLVNEIVAFLASRPTPNQILEYKISPEAQERLENLLYKKESGNASLAEMAEFNIYKQVSHLTV